MRTAGRRAAAEATLSVWTAPPGGALTRICDWSIMMLVRTTLTLDDDVLDAAKRHAREQDRPLKDVINEALRRGLALGEGQPRPAYKFRLRTVEGRLLPGVDLTDRDKLFELMERGSGA